MASPTVAAAPPEGGPRPWAGPAAVALSAAAGAVVLRQVDPAQPGHYPLCPFRALTGWDCPGCGSLRALHSLLHGDVVAALDHNLMTVLTLPVLVVVWLSWARRRVLGRARSFVLDARLVAALGALFVGFAVLRNLPGVPFLGSGVG